MKRFRFLVFAVALLIGFAFAVDRVTLLVWRFRVERYADRLQRSASQLHAGKRSGAPCMGWSGNRDVWAVPLLEVSCAGPEPTVITVDGNGGLNLTYVPPLLAWSRHVSWAYNRHPIQGADVYPYNDVYTLQIWTLEEQPGGKVLRSPTVTLEHGLPF